jgi:hypothetical protein
MSVLFGLSASIMAQNKAGLDAAAGQSSEDTGETTGASDWKMSTDEIAKELSNPVTALRSIAADFEFRTFQGSLPGADDKSSWIYLFTPSFPIPLSNGKNILLRATIPLYKDQPIWGLPVDHPLWQVDLDYAEFRIRQSPEITPSSGGFLPSHDHLADISFDVAYGGVSDNGFISMYGIVSVLPTSQDISASRDQWLLGPEVAFGKSADWGVIGGWVKHLTDITGGNSINTNETSLKLFFAYGLGNGWQIISNPVITYDWEAVSGEELSLPIGGGFAKTTRIGRMPYKLAFEIHNYVASADRLAPEWLLTLSFTPVIGNP